MSTSKVGTTAPWARPCRPSIRCIPQHMTRYTGCFHQCTQDRYDRNLPRHDEFIRALRLRWCMWSNTSARCITSFQCTTVRRNTGWCAQQTAVDFRERARNTYALWQRALCCHSVDFLDTHQIVAILKILNACCKRKHYDRGWVRSWSTLS